MGEAESSSSTHPGRVAAVLDVPIDSKRRICPCIGSDRIFCEFVDEVRAGCALMHAEKYRCKPRARSTSIWITLGLAGRPAAKCAWQQLAGDAKLAASGLEPPKAIENVM